MIGEIILNPQTGKPDENLYTISQYQPTKEVADFTLQIKKDYGVGYEIQHKRFSEFNDKSLLERMDADQKAFNVYVQPRSENPDEDWRWPGVRPLTRNKLISMAAHLIAVVLYPNVYAQNKYDQEDRDVANIMRWQIEWEIRNSDYEIMMLHAVIAALVNPVAYINVEFVEALQKIKERNERGEITVREVVDSIFSGMQFNNVPADEILISNAYQYYLQRQRFLIRRRFIDYDEATSLYGDHENFQYLQPGIRALYNEEEGVFYDQYDDTLTSLCEEVIYYNRTEDVEVPFVNGIYFGDTDVAANPIKHRTADNYPKYPYVKFGFEPIDEKRFYFYKSAAFKLAPDQELGDEMWRMVMDGTFLEIMPPIGVIGGEKIDTNVMFPGGVTSFGEGTEIKQIKPPSNLTAGYNALRLLEESMERGSQSKIREGIPEKGGQTAFEIARLEQNARIQLGLFGKMLGQAVVDLGELLIDNILRHRTVQEVSEVLGGETKLKYQTFILPEQTEKGRKVTRKLIFDENLIGKRMTPEEKLKESYKILKEEGGLEGNTLLYKINPEAFRNYKFKLMVNPDYLLPMSREFEKALNLEAYDRLLGNPYVDQEAITQDLLLEAVVPGQSQKYIKKQTGQTPVEQLIKGAPVRKEKVPSLVERVAEKSIPIPT